MSQNHLPVGDNDDELKEDDWFIDSIKRYKNLNMFELQRTPTCLALSDPQSICIVSSFNEAYSEINELSLPDKSLFENSLSNDSDLKLSCGTITESLVSQVEPLFKSNRIFCSELNNLGVIVYNLDVESGNIIKTNHLTNNLENPNISLNQVTGKILLSKSSNSDSHLIDINTGKTAATFNTGFKNNIDSSLLPLFISPQTVSFLNQKNGTIQLFDIQSKSLCGQTKLPFESNDDSVNFSSYNCNFFSSSNLHENSNSLNHSSSRIILCCNNGKLYEYDSRNLSTPFIKFDLKTKSAFSEQFIKLSFCPNSEKIIAISGLNENVYVFRTDSEMEELFVHDGHSHVENCNKSTVVTSHAWVNQSNIVSCALNKTLHFWSCVN